MKVIVVMDVHLRRLASTTPLGRLAAVSELRRRLATTELLPSLKEILLSLHTLSPEKVRLSQEIATGGRALLRLRRWRGQWLSTVAEIHRLELKKVEILLKTEKVQAKSPLPIS
jgi:hypothetical protein